MLCSDYRLSEYVHVFTVAWPVIKCEPAVVILSVGLDLSAPAPLFEHLTFARKHWEKTSQPDRQPVRQEAIQQRSLGLLGMIYALFRNAEWVQGALLLWELTEWALLAFSVTFTCCLNGYNLNVKMWRYCPIWTWNFQQIERQTEKEVNHWGPSLNFLSVLWQPPPRRRVGQPVGGWLPSKSEKLWYASLLHQTTQSRSFSERRLHLIWLREFLPVLGDFVPVV